MAKSTVRKKFRRKSLSEFSRNPLYRPSPSTVMDDSDEENDSPVAPTSSSRGEYTSTSYLPQTRDVLADLYGAWRRNGWKAGDFHDLLEDADRAVPPRTMREWRAARDAGDNVAGKRTRSGRPALLDEEQSRVLAGWAYDNYMRDQPISRSDAAKFVEEHFGVTIELSTVANYLRGHGLVNKKCQRKQAGFCLNKDESCEQMFEYVKQTHRLIMAAMPPPTTAQYADSTSSSSSSSSSSAAEEEAAVKPWLFDRSRLCSFDFVMTGRRTETVSSIAPAGMAQPREGGGYTRFTNCIATNVWGDGSDRTPAVLFTYDARFRRDGVTTPARIKKLKYLDDTLEKYGIDPVRVVYLGAGLKSGATYVSESADLVKMFFDLWEIPDDSVVLSDNGNSVASTKNGSQETPLMQAGFKTHLQYPAAVHQFLSPNDNRLHGAAKQKWRNAKLEKKNDVEASIRLLHDLDASMGHVSTWFDINMQLDKAVPTMQGVEAVVTSGSDVRRAHLEECRWEYLVETGQDGRGEVESVPKGLECGLNGRKASQKPKHRRRTR
jgi:transposase